MKYFFSFQPYIIRMEEIVDTPRNLYIVLELMEGGELFDRIRSYTNGLSEKCAKLIFYQVVLAVDYLHSRGITHRDLKVCSHKESNFFFLQFWKYLHGIEFHLWLVCNKT